MTRVGSGVRARMTQPIDPPVHRTHAEFWAHYLLHHRHPATRRLHFLGSAICLAGLALSLGMGAAWPLASALVLGYFCAFAGHWWVERNQPLTFRAPIRAGLANWRLFGVECLALVGVGGGFERALEKALHDAPHVLMWANCSSGQ
jgi:hypothetical protein